MTGFPDRGPRARLANPGLTGSNRIAPSISSLVQTLTGPAAYSSCNSHYTTPGLQEARPERMSPLHIHLVYSSRTASDAVDSPGSPAFRSTVRGACPERG